MNGSKFVKILATFNREDRRLLNKYLRDRKTSINSVLFKLCDYALLNCENSKKISNRDVFKTIYGNKVIYDEKRYRYLLAEGIKVLESFLIQNEIENDSALQNLLLAKAYRKHQLDKQHARVLKKANQQIEESPLRNRTYHYYKHEFQKEDLESRFDNQRRGELNLSNESNHLHKYFLMDSLMIESFRLTYEIYNPNKIVKSNFDKKTILEMVKKQEKDSPGIAVYQSIYLLLSEPDNTQHYQDLKKTVQKYWEQFPFAESKGILIAVINYCIRKINEQARSFITECFEWYQWGLGNGILLENGVLSSYNYKNIITLCLHSEQDVGLAEKTLEQHKSLLEPAKAENIYSYNLARVHFHAKSYGQTVDLLQSIKYNDLLDELDGRRMLLRIYFEEKEWVVLDSFLLSFIAFINRQKSLGYHKDYYLNLVRYVKKALKFPSFNTIKKKKFIEEIKGVRKMNDKQWLVDQLDRMT